MPHQESFDPDRLRLAQALPTKLGPPRAPPRHKPGEKFLRGPIPWSWLSRACVLPGKAMIVGLALWFWAGLEKKRTVRVRNCDLQKLGVGRDAARRGLSALAHSGLISVDRHPGRSPIVTLLEGPSEDTENAQS